MVARSRPQDSHNLSVAAIGAFLHSLRGSLTVAGSVALGGAIMAAVLLPSRPGLASRPAEQSLDRQAEEMDPVRRARGQDRIRPMLVNGAAAGPESTGQPDGIPRKTPQQSAAASLRRLSWRMSSTTIRGTRTTTR